MEQQTQGVEVPERDAVSGGQSNQEVQVAVTPTPVAPNYEVPESPPGSIFYTSKGAPVPGDPAKAPTH